jgi:type VI secretion system protein ImpA
MPLREDILEPIPGENPSGTDLRYSPIYDKIKEARREDDGLPQGDWVEERKVADHRQVIELTQEALATRTKDLWLAAWLVESLVVAQGFAGLNDGIGLLDGLLRGFWDTLFPALEDGDAEQRVAPLDWIGSRLNVTVKSYRLCRDNYSFFQYQDSRLIVYENQGTKEQKARRETALKEEGKIAPEIIDKAFKETPKEFYADAEKSIDGSLGRVNGLDALCREKFGDAVAPSFEKLKASLGDIRKVVHKTLDEKRKTEPDPIEAPPLVPEETSAEANSTQATPGGAMSGVPGVSFANITAAFPPLEEVGDRSAAVASVAAAAAFLRQREPYSPAPYLLLRGLRWGELRASQDPTVLEAAPTEMRRQIKTLAMNNRWSELLEAAENVMALPCGRAWLDLQRFVVEACVALGREYDAVAIAIRSEVRALLRDLPQLLDATLSDDTPAANADTQAWLRELLAEPAGAPPLSNLPRLAGPDNKDSGWQKKFIDPHALAGEAMRQGKPQRAFEIMHEEIERQRSGRGRFQRKMQLAQMCVAAGKDAIAQPLLDDLAAAIEAHKLEDWEDPELVAGALAFLMQSSKRIQSDAKLKQAMFERICRLDPVQALSV